MHGKTFIYLYILVLAFCGSEAVLIYSGFHLQLVELYAISSVNVWERSKKLSVVCNMYLSFFSPPAAFFVLA